MELMNDLFKDRRISELLDILKLDNILIALGVEQRELTWSSFMAYLLHPARNDKGRAQLFLNALLEIAFAMKPELLTPKEKPSCSFHKDIFSSDLPQILGVKTEYVCGQNGRADVFVDCSINYGRLIIVVENKINSRERDGQLADYVRFLEDTEKNCTIMPMLIQLGDEPADEASHLEAIIWKRHEVKAWLSAGKEAIISADIKAPKLIAIIDDYLDLCRAMELAAEITQDESLQSQIEMMKQAKGTDTSSGWLLLQDWISSDDRPFFRKVIEQREMVDALEEFKLEASVYGTILGRNEGMQITKLDWTLPPPVNAKKTHGVNVHFESTKRGYLNLHVELDPYETNLDSKPELAEQVSLKSQVLTSLRQRIIDLAEDNPALGATTKHLRNPEWPSTLCAVSFYPSDPMVEQDHDKCGKFFAAVIEGVAPMVKETIESLKK